MRYYYIIARNILRLPKLISTMRKMADDEACSEKERYDYIQYVIGLMKRTGLITTEVYGEENLPKEGGYVMYPNHQGKYDAYGIASVHKKTCTVVMDQDKSYGPFIRGVTDMLKGKCLDKKDIRQ